MADIEYLKEFIDGEKITSKDTNDNNNFLLDKISSNATNLQGYVNTKVANVISSNQSLIEIVRPIGAPIIRLDNTLNSDEIRLEGATVSRTDYANLFKIYGTTYGEGDGSTTFQLPNFLDHSIWGASDFGYVEGALPNITGTSNPVESEFGGTGGSGALYTTRSSSSWAGGAHDGRQYVAININASRSSKLYKSVSYNQPTAVKIRVVTRYK